MRRLEEILAACAPSRRKLAEEIGMAASALTQLLNHGTLPKRRWPEIRERLLSLAEAHGTSREETEAALKKADGISHGCPYCLIILIYKHGR